MAKVNPLLHNPKFQIKGKEDNAGNQHFFFHTISSTPPKTNLIFSVTFILSSASALNFDQSKILSFDERLSNYPLFNASKHEAF